MTLQASGAIEISDIQTELSESGAANVGKTSFRDLAVVPSGEIKVSDFYGKAAGGGAFVITMTNDPIDSFVQDSAIVSWTLDSSGAVSPLSYVWEYVSGDASVTISNILDKFPFWSAPNTTGTYSTTWRITYTDSTPFVPQTTSGLVTINFDFT
jgi:hypothetical protein